MRTISAQSPRVHGSPSGCATTSGAMKVIAPTRRSIPRATAGASTRCCRSPSGAGGQVRTDSMRLPEALRSLARTDGDDDASGQTGPMKQNINLLYGFSFFDQFMIMIALWVPYLATQGIGMRQFMELQAVFALVILCGEVPSGLLWDLWGRKKTLLLGAALKAVSFSLLPLWSSYEGFLFYHLTMGIALSMISGGDIALLYDSHLATGGENRGTAILGNAKLAAQTGTTLSALLGSAIVTLSYGHLLWANDPELDPGASRAERHRAARGPPQGKEVVQRVRRSPLHDPGTRRRNAARIPQSGRRGDRRTGDVLGEPEILAGEWGGPGVVWSPAGWLRSHPRPRREIRRFRGDEIRPATVAHRGRRVARHRVFRDGVVPRMGRDHARDPGPGRPRPGRGALPGGAQRENLLRVPRDRDLPVAAGNPRFLLSSGPARGLRDRRLGT